MTRNLIKTFYCGIIFILSTLYLNAQNVMFFNSKQGLSNSCIYNIYEDSRHNIWITTQNGLNRYDGVRMNVYRHEDNNPHSLQSNDVDCVYEYDHNRILIGTGTGIQVFNYPTNKFESIPFVSLTGDTIMPRIYGLFKFKDNGKDRFMATISGFGNGEIYADENGNLKIKHIDTFNTGFGVNPRHFFQDKKGRLWITNEMGNVFRRTGKTFKGYNNLGGVMKLHTGTTGKIYAITNNSGIYYYNDKTDSFSQIVGSSEMGGEVYGFKNWSKGKIFICTDGGGLRVFDENTGKVTQSSIRVNDFNLATSNVKDALIDSYGNVWIGIYWKGVMMKPNTQSSFEYVGRHSITKNTIGTNSVFAMAKADENNIWIATDNDGLYKITSDGTNASHWCKENTPNMPSAFTVIAPQKDGSLLLGTFSDGLWKMNNGVFTKVPFNINRIFDIQPANGGYYWISTLGQGLYCYNPETGKYVNYMPDYANGDKGRKIVNNNYIYCAIQHGENLFIGTADGVNICKVKGAENKLEGKTRILDGKGCAIKHFAISKDGKTAWIAYNNGLCKFDMKTFEQKNYTTKEGLPNNSIQSLQIEGNHLWIGTDDGLSCLDIQKETFTNFFADDGIQDNEFCRGSVLELNNNFYFGGISGLTYFNDKNIEKRLNSNHKLDLRLVNLIVGGKIIHEGDQANGYNVLNGVLDDCAHIELSNSSNHFTIQLRVDGLINQHVTYEYCIDGGEWMNQGENTNRLVFDNLKTGTYHIKIRALALGSISEERELTVKIHPAWYASPGALCFYFIILLIMCWLTYQYVMRQFKARRVLLRHRQEQQINEARVQFFMNISHEIRTPMTLILAPLEKLLSIDKDPERQRHYQLIKHNSKRILRLVNQMMDVRKIEEGKFLLNYQKVEIISFLQNIYDVFQTNAQSRNIEYVFEHDVDYLNIYVDPDNTDKIVMNLLSNAFKFTPDGGKITLSFSVPENGKDSFTIMVTDNGQGIKEEDKSKVFERFYSANQQNGYMGTGIGLNLTYMLVRLHKGTISVTDNPESKGTRFIINMPVGDTSLLTMKPEEPKTTQEIEEHETPAEELLSIEKPTDTHRKNVVLVEDDEAIRQYVHSELSDTLLITEFGNGQQAWDYIIANPTKVDLIISDIMMPVMDGLTLCQKVKSNFNTSHIAIILMTALGSDSDRIAGISNGADAYVSKPFNIDVLRSTALGLIRNRRLIQGKIQGDKHHEEMIEHVDVESPDEHLMKRVMKVISENMDNPELSVEIIADKVGISRVHFYRKMKDLTGQAPRDYIKYVRLKEAARLLSEKKLDITGVSIATGFKSLSAFSTNFKGLYGLSPSEWVKKQEKEQE